jgi:ADP-heptose:LPS heptosyltransferase
MGSQSAHSPRLSAADRVALDQCAAELRGDATPDVPRVLLVVAGSFGDALQVTPLLHNLRRRFERAKLTLINPNSLVRSLLAGSPNVDRVCALPRNAHRILCEMGLAEGWTDLIVECRYAVTYTLPSYATGRFSTEQLALIKSAMSKQREWLQFLSRFPFDNDELWQAAAARGWSMYRLMAETSGFGDADFEAFRLTLGDEDLRARRSLPNRYLAVCNSAETQAVTFGMPTKILPREKMSRVVRALKTFEVPVVLLGTSNDARIDGVDVDLRGRTTIREAAAVLREAEALVGPEGGLVNLARSVGTRSVVFFGSTPPEFFGFRANINVLPQRCGGCWWTTPSYLYQCPRLLAVPECTESILETQIVTAVGEILRVPASEQCVQ